jgi:glycosyl transferase family 2
MKLMMTLLVRDEEDILRENLEFHLAQGVDEFILMDNLSVDATPEIAREYERAGSLHYVRQPYDDYAQGRWVTEMARRAAQEFGADWVINSDADEFWWPHTGSLKDVFASIAPDIEAAAADRVNFVPRVQNGLPFWRLMNVRQTLSLNALGEPLPSKTAHRGRPDVVVGQGNHRVTVGGVVIPSTAAPITILHFPIRSQSQFVNKIAKGGAAYARNTDLAVTVGSAWRYLYGLHMDGRLQSWYGDQVFSEDAIAAGLANGTLLHDERLSRTLDEVIEDVAA